MITSEFRAVLDTHYQEDEHAKNKVSLMMKDSNLIEDGRLAMEVDMSHDDVRMIMMMMMMKGVPGHTEG